MPGYLIGEGNEKEYEMSKQNILKIGIALFLVVAVLAVPLSNSLAAANPAGTGQPGADCEAIGVTPGHAASAPGSAFNPDGHAGTVYAGEQPQNSKNPNSVS